MSEKKDTSAMGRVEHGLRVYDQMTTMHFSLSEKYHRWTLIEKTIEIVLSVVLCGCTFLDVDKHEALKRFFGSIDLSLIMGGSSIVLFAFTLIKQNINHHQRCEQHRLAGKILAQSKAELRLKQNEWINENTEEAVINAYLDQLASTVNDLPQIPEKYFAKYKHKHVRKKEFSQFIDRHKASPWLWCKILFLLKGLGLYEKENKNIAKRSPKGDLASADMK